MSFSIDSEEVSRVNKQFYDKIADVYYRVDRRRNGSRKHTWLEDILKRIKSEIRTGSLNPSFLDAGAGSGFLSMHAISIFSKMTLVDISEKMLQNIELSGVIKIQADCNKLPLDDKSIDVIGAFATLHHLFDHQVFISEAYRVLKPGGILYCDHDIERAFVRNFKIPLAIYRYFFDHGKDYLKLCPAATKKEYQSSEWQGNNGIDIISTVESAKKIGFEVVELSCHWEGMGPFERFFKMVGIGKIMTQHGRAPVARFILRKAI